MRPVAVAVGVSILDEKRADVHGPKVARADFGGHVQVKDYSSIGACLHAIEESSKPLFGKLGGGFHAIDFEVIYAEAAVQLQQADGVAFPIRKVVARIRSKP